MIKCVYDLIYRPFPNTADNKVTISSDGLTVNYGKGYNLYVRSNLPIPLPTSKIYTEYTITSATTVHYSYICLLFGVFNTTGKSIFFSTESAKCGDSTVFRTFSNYIEIGPSKSFVKGHTIGLAVDCKNNTLTIYKNGTELGSFTSSIVDTFNDKVTYLGFYNGTVYENYTVSANFGLTSFKYPVPEGYISLEEEYKYLFKDNDLYIY